MSRTGFSWGGWWVISTGVGLMLAAAVVWPAARVVGTIRSGAGVEIGLLAGSVGVAVLIAVLAVLAAVPGAWVIRRARAAGVVLLAAPMLMPSYLAYTGWGVLRSPDTAVGGWLLRGDIGDANRLPVLAGQVLAVVGLVLWVWPVAALILGLRLRRVEDSVLESLAMDARSRWRSGWEVACMCRGAACAAGMVVAVVMLGSAVPLHLAQLDTYAIKIWRVLDQTPRDEIGRVWVSAWPLVMVAGVCGFVIARRVMGMDVEGWAERGRGGSGGRVGVGGVRWGWGVATGVVWALGVAGPVVLLVWSVRRWWGVWQFLEVSRGPLVSSVVVAVGVGLVVGVVAVWTWWALGRRDGVWRRVGVVVGGVMLAAGLLPGVLVGVATSRAWAGWQVGDSPLVVVLAHVTRFGMVGVIVGWWLAAMEGRWAMDLRRMDVGERLRGWWEASIRPQIGIVVAGSVVAALLSFHEIESTVMVQPASASGGSFAWQMLQWLHFARMDELAMGVLGVVGLGVGGLALTWMALAGGGWGATGGWRRSKNRSESGNPEPIRG